MHFAPHHGPRMLSTIANSTTKLCTHNKMVSSVVTDLNQSINKQINLTHSLSKEVSKGYYIYLIKITIYK